MENKMKRLVAMHVKSWAKCCSCGEHARSFEKRFQVQRLNEKCQWVSEKLDGGKKGKVENYCKHCEYIAKINHEDIYIAKDMHDEPSKATLRRVRLIENNSVDKQTIDAFEEVFG